MVQTLEVQKNMINYSACSTKGKSRKINQDRVMVNNQCIDEGGFEGKSSNELIAIVCDGVGSTKGSENAAEFVSNSFKDCNIARASPMLISRHLHKLNRKIIHNQKDKNDSCCMATTVAGVMLYKNKYMLFNLGDTRIYEFSDGVLKQISKDHIAEKDINNKNTNIITSYLGGYGYGCKPYMRTGSVTKDTYFVICSDGIYKEIEENALKNILLSKVSLEDKKRAILELSLKNGSTDDMSVVLIECA